MKNKKTNAQIRTVCAIALLAVLVFTVSCGSNSPGNPPPPAQTTPASSTYTWNEYRLVIITENERAALVTSGNYILYENENLISTGTASYSDGKIIVKSSDNKNDFTIDVKGFEDDGWADIIGIINGKPIPPGSFIKWEEGIVIVIGKIIKITGISADITGNAIVSLRTSYDDWDIANGGGIWRYVDNIDNGSVTAEMEDIKKNAPYTGTGDFYVTLGVFNGKNPPDVHYNTVNKVSINSVITTVDFSSMEEQKW